MSMLYDHLQHFLRI